MSVRVRNVQAGFYDAHGFHPLRRSVDYDPDRPHEFDTGAYSDGGGLKRKRGAKAGRKVKRHAKAKPKGRKRNGRSYVRKGESVPSWHEPKAGEVWYLGGKRGVIKRVGHDAETGKPYVWFTREVDGILAMSVGNLIQAGRLQKPEAKNPARRNGLRPAKGKLSPRVGAALTRYVRGTGTSKRNPPHPGYAKQVGGSVGLNDARDGKPRKTVAEMKDHYERAFSASDESFMRQLPDTFSAADIARAKAEYRKAVAGFIAGYRYGYKRGKEGFRGFGSHLDREIIDRDDARRKRRNPKATYTYSGGYYYSNRKKDRAKGTRVASLPRGYAKGADGVYRYSKAARNPRARMSVKGVRYDAEHNRTYIKVATPEFTQEYFVSGYVTKSQALGMVKDRVTRDLANIRPNPGKRARAERKRYHSVLRARGLKATRGPRSLARFESKMQSSYSRGRATKAPALKSNPRGGIKVYSVRVPRSGTMPGYQMQIRAKKKTTAIAEARAYCTRKHGTAPRGIKATEVRRAA